MNHSDAWQRLAAAARRAPDGRDASAPYGFAARVAALALSQERRPASVFDYFSLKLSLRVMGASCLLAVAAAGASYPTLVTLFSNQESSEVASSRETAPPAAAPLAVPAARAPSLDIPAPAAPASDDPVAELVGIVS